MYNLYLKIKYLLLKKHNKIVMFDKYKRFKICSSFEEYKSLLKDWFIY